MSLNKIIHRVDSIIYHMNRELNRIKFSYQQRNSLIEIDLCDSNSSTPIFNIDTTHNSIKNIQENNEIKFTDSTITSELTTQLNKLT